MFEKANIDDIQSAFDDLGREPASPRRLWILKDGWNLNADEIQRLADYTKSKAPAYSIRLAIVTTEKFSFGLLRMFAVYRDAGLDSRAYASDMQIFPSETKAVTWLKSP